MTHKQKRHIFHLLSANLSAKPSIVDVVFQVY